MKKQMIALSMAVTLAIGMGLPITALANPVDSVVTNANEQIKWQIEQVRLTQAQIKILQSLKIKDKVTMDALQKLYDLLIIDITKLSNLMTNAGITESDPIYAAIIPLIRDAVNSLAGDISLRLSDLLQATDGNTNRAIMDVFTKMIAKNNEILAGATIKDLYKLKKLGPDAIINSVLKEYMKEKMLYDMPDGQNKDNLADDITDFVSPTSLPIERYVAVIKYYHDTFTLLGSMLEDKVNEMNAVEITTRMYEASNLSAADVEEFYQEKQAQNQTKTSEQLHVSLNGRTLNFPDEKPYTSNTYRTMVPVRFIAEGLGSTVNYDNGHVMITYNSHTIILYINSNKALIDGKETLLDATAVIKNDRTFVPLRFIAEAFGQHVEWDAQTQTVLISAS